jgi:pimeloyl-ACP methyl ester carboxylesterase
MSVAGQADDAAVLLAGLGIGPAVVFGGSGGGNILLELVARRPEVVRAAIVQARVFGSGRVTPFS